MNVYKVEFIGIGNAGVIKTGLYRSKRTIRQAQERISLEYGAHVGTRITLDGKEISIWTLIDDAKKGV